MANKSTSINTSTNKRIKTKDINAYITNALLTTNKSKKDDFPKKIKLEKWGINEGNIKDNINKLTRKFVSTFFEFNGYKEDIYNNSPLVELFYKMYNNDDDSAVRSYVEYVLYTTAASFINNCYPFTDIQDKINIDEDAVVSEVVIKFVYKYLTWAFSSPDDNYIEWNIFNKKTNLYGNVRYDIGDFDDLT